MRPLIFSMLALVLAGCGTSMPTEPQAAFALAAGNYDLKVIGTGTCTSSGSKEGVAPVIVSPSGSSYLVVSSQGISNFTLTLTTDGTATGSVRGTLKGTLPLGQGVSMAMDGAVTGNNTAANVAGGPISAASSPAFVVTFTEPSGGSSCVSGTWTLTPR